MSDLLRSAHEIEQKSFDIISAELGDTVLDPREAIFIKRSIHTSADFDYVNLLKFSDQAIQAGIKALQSGHATIYCDTTMALSGINKAALRELGAEVVCYVSDDDVVKQAKEQGTTRAQAAIDKSLHLKAPVIYAIGNAPTALLRLVELVRNNKVSPALVIGAPVGFVNVMESKEELLKLGCEHIVVQGRKGGSNISAALINAFLYGITRGEFDALAR